MTPTLTAALITTAALTITALLPTTPTTGLHLTTTTGCEDLSAWTAPTNPVPVLYPLVIGQETGTTTADICARSPTVVGNIPWTDREKWFTTHDGTGVRMWANAGQVTVHNPYVENVSDAIDINGQPGGQVTVTGAHVVNGRDDCIEDDDGVNLTVTDSLFESCFVFLSMRPIKDRQNPIGAGPATVILDGVFANLGNHPITCKKGRQQYCSQGLGSHALWKWSSAGGAHSFTVRNSTFRADRPSFSTTQANQWPAGTYQNVTFVWTWPEPYPQPLPPGVTLTTNPTVWENARTQWLTNHPQVNR